MSSAPSERAWQWASEEYGGNDPSYYEEARAFDAGYSEGEKKGTIVGYLAALREVKKEIMWTDTNEKGEPIAVALPGTWLDRRIREAEENAK